MPSDTKTGFRSFSLSPCGFYNLLQLYGRYRHFPRPLETPQGDCATHQDVLLWHSQPPFLLLTVPCEPVYHRYPAVPFWRNAAHMPLYGVEFQSASRARVWKTLLIRAFVKLQAVQQVSPAGVSVRSSTPPAGSYL